MVKYSQKPEVFFSAIAHGARREMVEALAKNGELSVSELAEPLLMSLPGALKHVRVLEDSGLVSCSKRGRVQYCAMNANALTEMLGWLHTQREFWEASFIPLDEHLDQINRSKKKK